MFLPNYKMPSKQELDNKQKNTISENKLKDKIDCEMMYNFINQTLYNAVHSKKNINIYETDHKRDIFYDYKNINIENCDGYNDYITNLEERGIEYTHKYIQSYSTFTIRYNVVKKELLIL